MAGNVLTARRRTASESASGTIPSLCSDRESRGTLSPLRADWLVRLAGAGVLYWAAVGSGRSVGLPSGRRSGSRVLRATPSRPAGVPPARPDSAGVIVAPEPPVHSEQPPDRRGKAHTTPR